MRLQLAVLAALLALTGVFATHTSGGVALGTEFTYQGSLHQGGQPVDGTVDMIFRLYNLPVAGAQVGGNIFANDVDVNGGVFSVILNFGDVFQTAQGRFLEIEVDGVTLSPRQWITTSPVATYSQNTRGIQVDSDGDVGVGESGTAYQFQSYTDDRSRAIYGNNFNTNPGTMYGVYGRATSPDGYGVYGLHDASSGTNAGVYGETDSSDASAYGVHGKVDPSSAGSFSAGVRGENDSTSGSGIGVHGSQNGGGWGVYGETPSGIGVYGLTTSGIGVRGSSTNDRGGWFTSTNDVALEVGGGVHSIGANDISNDDIVVEDSDAIIGMFSDGGGTFGSGIALREISGGNVVDTWGIIRETSAADADLRFTYGSSESQASNAQVVRFTNYGKIDGTWLGLNQLNSNAYLHVTQPAGINVDPMRVERESGGVGTYMRFFSSGGFEGGIFSDGAAAFYTPFTGCHYAKPSESLSPGMLVRMTGDNERTHDGLASEMVYGIEAVAHANDPACLGAYMHADSAGAETSISPPHFVASVGNGDLLVTDDGRGDISPGDLLISSGVPGCAMKDDPKRFATGYIIARAAQRVNWTDVLPDADGVRRTRISVLFDSCLRGGGGNIEALTDKLDQQQRQIERLSSQLAKLLAEREEVK